MNPPATHTQTPVVTLAELPAMTGMLAQKIRDAGYRPDVIVYIESGARLPAAHLCRELRVGAVPVLARRAGHGLKRLMAPLASFLPRGLMNAMRRVEERSGVHGRTRRTVIFPVERDFGGKAVLVMDDATDTGGTLLAVKQALIARGADAGRMRCAVLAATTVAGRVQADFYVSERNSVLPWSSDSAERKEAQALMERTVIPGP